MVVEVGLVATPVRRPVGSERKTGRPVVSGATPRHVGSEGGQGGLCLLQAVPGSRPCPRADGPLDL